ncbi:alpha/beta fold hydrolase [Alteromonas sp. KUL49]|uniref:alpha/beta fold hydrolase n=1 Tax=Alteromonas sp. KUL49 TaxID=2480798 RepID=UPI00102F1F79|nr:alpha/beta fold hydrolase [Alteromonas sp. KUL49]TAP40633.1 alpha/beta fold hydrolase [Alteromonas sp. KUL49]GEA10794.1 acyl-CoA esterase [Alteromonas sp. KUL49]
MSLHHSISISPTNAQAPWLVLIHGLFGNADNLAVVKRHFATQYNIVSVDLPDHGQSDWSNEFTLDDAAIKLKSLLDTLSISRCAILGHSLGGKVAMLFSLTHPDNVTKLIVADIAPVNYTHRHQAVFDGLTAVTLESLESRKHADQLMSQHIVEPGVRQFLLKSLYQDENKAWRWRFNLHGLIESYPNIISWPDISLSTQCPTLFIKGNDSDYILPEHRSSIAKHFPKAKAHVIEGTGHWLHAEKPAAFNRIVENYLK